MLLIVTVLVMWAFCGIWVIRDWLIRKLNRMSTLSAVFRNENIQNLLEQLHHGVRSRRYHHEHVELVTKRDALEQDLELNETRADQDEGGYDSDEDYETNLWDRLCPYFMWCVSRALAAWRVSSSGPWRSRTRRVGGPRRCQILPLRRSSSSTRASTATTTRYAARWRRTRTSGQHLLRGGVPDARRRHEPAGAHPSTTSSSS